jgi:hypothetical protein
MKRNKKPMMPGFFAVSAQSQNMCRMKQACWHSYITSNHHHHYYYYYRHYSPINCVHVRFEVFMAMKIALMMKAARSSETLVNFYQTTRRYNPEDSNLRQR